MPKSRYKIMTDYMPKVGGQGHDMMYRTTTIQVNLDFSDERDMVRKLQTSLKLQPLASALFANSPFKEGKPANLLSGAAIFGGMLTINAAGFSWLHAGRRFWLSILCGLGFENSNVFHHP